MSESYIVIYSNTIFPWIKPSFSLTTAIHQSTDTHVLTTHYLELALDDEKNQIGEIPCDENNDDDFATIDSNAILSFRPDRLGHSLLLTESMFATLDDLQIPVECCPTSNVMTLELAKNFEGDLVHGLRKHPRLKRWIDERYPISINTDDPGIFNTNPTHELALLAEAFGLGNGNGNGDDGDGDDSGGGDPCIILNIIEESVEHCFESKEFRRELKGTLGRRVRLLKEQFFGESLVN